MAVDGSLIFDTKIDTDGVAKGTKQVSSKMKEVSSKVIELKNKISSAEKEVANLTQELEKMANTPIKSDITEKLEKDIGKAKNQLRSLYEEADRIGNAKQADLTSMGFGTEYLDNMLSQDENWNKVQKQIDDAETKLQEYERELKQVKSAESNVTGKDTAEYAEKKKKLEDLSGKLNVYKAKLREAENEEKSNKKELKSTVDVFEQFSKALKNVYSRLKKAFNSTIVKTIKNIGKNTSHTNSQMNLLSKSLQRIKQALAGLLLYKVLQGGLKGIKEGIDNLAQVNPKVNENLSALITSLDYLKNSLATAFAPILNVVTPILTGFMDTLSTVTDKVAQFIAALTGQSEYTKAVKIQKDYAASLTDTASAAKENTKAAKENQKYLAGYDELNVMPDNSSSDTFTSTNNANEIVPSEMFTTSYITGGISDFAKRVKELFQKQDFEGLGQLAADKLNKAMSKINWSKIRNTAKKWAGNIAGFLNGAVEKLDWFLTGTTIGNGIMTAVDFAYTFLTTFNFTELGVGIANALNGLFSTIDWSELGATFGAVLQAIISTGFGFVTTFDWEKAGLSISDLINGFFTQIDWAMAGQTISNGIIGAFSTISTALQNIDWEQIGKDIGEFFANIDWWGILVSAITGIVEMLAGLWEENPIAAVIMTIVAALGAFAVIMAIVNAVMMVNPITWIVLGIMALIAAIVACIVYWDDICKAIQSAWEWICDLFSDVGGWIWDNLISPVIGFFETLWTSVCDIFQNIADFIKGIWDGIWNSIKWVINLIIDGINSLWTGIYTVVKGIVDSIGGIAGAIGDIFGQDWHFSMPSEPPLIPKLATGTVVPASYGEFLAVLGDNKREPEVVSPLSTMKQAVKEAIAEINLGSNDGGNEEINIYLDGEKVFKVMVDKNYHFKKSHGYSAFS